MFALDRRLQRTITSARDKERLTSWDPAYLVQAPGDGEPDADADGGMLMSVFADISKSHSPSAVT